MVSRLTENESILKNQLSTLKDLKKSPYFGRIDIQDQGDTEPEKLYIGIALFENEDGEFLVYDWRAPISSVYYNGTLGEVSNQTPIGEQKTTLKKKRQFQIVDGQIRNMLTPTRLLVMKCSKARWVNRPINTSQNIVATIQHEQNDIIRDTTSNLLVVQELPVPVKRRRFYSELPFYFITAEIRWKPTKSFYFHPINFSVTYL